MKRKEPEDGPPQPSPRVGGPFTSAVKEESTDASGLKPQSSLPGGGAPGGAGGPGKPRDGGRGPRRFPVDLAPEPNILQEVVIHKKLTGKVIGPGGETAKDIRRHAQCHLHVRKEPRPDDMQVVEVSGNAQQVKAGVARVVDLVTQEAGDDKSLIPRIPPNTAITYFDVLPEMIGYVLGNRGATVKTLREKTGTQIQITDASPETGLQAITVRGNPDSVQEAYGIIRSMLEKFDPRRSKGPPAGLSLPSANKGPGAGNPRMPNHPLGPSQGGFHGRDGPAHGGYGGPPGRFAEEYQEPFRGGDRFRNGPPMHHGGPDFSRGPRDEYAAPAEQHGGYGGAPGGGFGRPGPGEYSRGGGGGQEGYGAPAAVAERAGAEAAAATAGVAGAPPVLVLHPDGQYRPAPAGAAAGAPGATGGVAGLGLSNTAALTQLLQMAAANNPALASLATALQHATQGAMGPNGAQAYGQAPSPGYGQPAATGYGQPAATAYGQTAAAAAYGQAAATGYSAAAYAPPAQYAAAQYTAPAGGYAAAAPSAYSAQAYNAAGYPPYAYPTDYSAAAAAAPAATQAAAQPGTAAQTQQQVADYYSHYSKLYQAQAAAKDHK